MTITPLISLWDCSRALSAWFIKPLLPSSDKWAKWGSQHLPPTHSLPSLLTLTALSVYISVSASLHLDQQRRQPVSTYRLACRPAPTRSICQKQFASAAPTRPRRPATTAASLSSPQNTFDFIHSCLNINRPSVPAVFLHWILARIFVKFDK